MSRLREWLQIVALAFDAWVQTIIFGFAFVLGFGPKPERSDTISAVVGRNAIKERPWALFLEVIIDWIFERLGEAPDHCRRAAAEAA